MVKMPRMLSGWTTVCVSSASRTSRGSRRGLVGVTLVLALVAGAGHQARATRSTTNVVVEWNQIVQDTVPGAGGVLAPRFYAMVHIAMFDAVNAIEREFSPYRVRLRDRGRGSPEAAAAQAAHDVLVALNAPAAAVYTAALDRHLGKHPSDYVRRGAAVGAHVARKILA